MGSFSKKYQPSGALAIFLLGFIISSASAQDTISYHPVRTNDSGELLPWYNSDPGTSYDFCLRQVWDFWQKVPECNGAKNYMVNRTWDPECNASGIGGGEFSMALSSWNLLYDYLGDPAVLDNMRYIADTYLAHGLSDSTDAWPNIPYPCNLQLQAVYDGDLVAGEGVTQPDKAGTFGAELVMLYKKTGDAKYLQAAVAIANTLAQKIQSGDSGNSPLPYRVNAHTGEVVDSYTANWTPTMRLFEELIKLGQGHTDSFNVGLAVLGEWLKAYPMKNDVWGPYFEDVPIFSNTEINAISAARYVLDHPDWDPNWQQDARRILDATYDTFNDSNWANYGAIAIDEQTSFLMPGQSHTSRYASAELHYAEKTGDTSRVARSVLQLNWATYMVDWNGANRYPNDSIWYTDGYGDYVRHYLRAIASDPSLAPSDSNHILSTNSVIQNVSYSGQGIVYSTFDSSSTEHIRLLSKPSRVRSGSQMLTEYPAPDGAHSLQTPGWSWRPLQTGGVIEIHHAQDPHVEILTQEASVSSAKAVVPISIFPNPMSSRVMIGATNDRNAKIEIVDAIGRVVASHIGAGQFNWDARDLSGAQVANGIYLLRVTGVANGSITKLVVSR